MDGGLEGSRKDAGYIGLLEAAIEPDLQVWGGVPEECRGRDGGRGARLSPLPLMLEGRRAGGATLRFGFGTEPLPAPFCGDPLRVPFNLLVLFGRRGVE